VTKNCSSVCRKRAYKLRQREEKIKASLIEQQTTLATSKKQLEGSLYITRI